MKKIIILSFLCGWNFLFFAMEIENYKTNYTFYCFRPELSKMVQLWNCNAKWILDNKPTDQPDFASFSKQPFPFDLTIESNKDKSKYCIFLNQTIDNENYKQPIKTKNLQLLLTELIFKSQYNQSILLVQIVLLVID